MTQNNSTPIPQDPKAKVTPPSPTNMDGIGVAPPAHNPVAQVTEVTGSPQLGQPKHIANVITYTDLTRDTMPSGFLSSYLPLLQSLPNAFDDLTQQFGHEVYARMLYDSEISAAIGLLTLATCAAMPRIVPSVDPGNVDYEFAREIARSIQGDIENTTIPFSQALEQVVQTALAYGSCVADLIYEVRDGRLHLKAMKPRKVSDSVFVVDNYNNLMGTISTRVPNVWLPINGAIPIAAYQDYGKEGRDLILRGLTPRIKTLIFTWMPPSGDPRGTSILRPVYTAWWAKQQIINEMMTWFARYAQPLLVGTLAPEAQTITTTDENGVTTTFNPVTAMADAISRVKSGSGIVVPHEAKVEAIPIGSAGDAYLKGITWANTEIVRGLLKQHLATAEGLHMSRAASETHQDVLSLLIRHLKNRVAEAVRNDVFKTLTQANFGIAAKLLAPNLDLGMGDGFPLGVKDVAALFNVGYFTDEQLAAMDRLIGAPPRTKLESMRTMMATQSGGAGGMGPGDGASPDFTGAGATGGGGSASVGGAGANNEGLGEFPQARMGATIES